MPFPTLGNLGPPLALNYNDEPTPAEIQRLYQQRLQNRALSGIGMPVYEPPNLDRNTYDPMDQMLYNWFKSHGAGQEQP